MDMSRPAMRTGSPSHNLIAPTGLRRPEAGLSPESHDPIMRPGLIHGAADSRERNTYPRSLLAQRQEEVA